MIVRARWSSEITFGELQETGPIPPFSKSPSWWVKGKPPLVRTLKTLKALDTGKRMAPEKPLASEVWAISSVPAVEDP